MIIMKRIMYNKYQRLQMELEQTGTGRMKCFGSSMTPILPSGGVMTTYRKQDDYEVGDIVFCRVHGRFIDAHLITKKAECGFLISNNHGHDNGWTKQVFGKVVVAEWKGGSRIF